MKCINLVYSCIVLAISQSAFASTKSPANLPKILVEVEKKYSEAKSLAADFTQVTETASTGKKKTSYGKIFVKRPDKVRWETFKPDPNLLISDGKTFWYYTPPFEEGEKGQLVEKRSSQVQSKLAQALLSGSFSAARDMTIKQKSPSLFIMVPKVGAAGTVTQATIEIDQRNLIHKVILDHQGGNKAEISLTQIELGKKVNDDLFTFTAPPDTDRIEEDK